jgi:acetyl esterase/lipase
VTGYAYDTDLVEAAAALTAVPSDIADLEVARRLSRAIVTGGRPFDPIGVAVDRRVVPGRAPGEEVPVVVVAPEGDATDGGRGALLCIHGGGFSIGSAEDDLGFGAWLARELGIVVVLVEYRLAPEHPYPCGLDDCFAALSWVHAAAAEIGVDRSRVGVYGSSAGATIAAGLALQARDLGGPALCLQFLAIPVLDDRLATPSMREFVDTPVWHRRNAALSWAYYLGGEPEDERPEVPPYASPARAEDLAGLPPTYISTAEFDPLRDEGVTYALRLLQAGVPVELHQYAGTFHGSLLVPTARSTHRQLEEMLEVMGRSLDPSRAAGRS